MDALVRIVIVLGSCHRNRIPNPPLQYVWYHTEIRGAATERNAVPLRIYRNVPQRRIFTRRTSRALSLTALEISVGSNGFWFSLFCPACDGCTIPFAIMNNTTQSSSILTIALRVQADRAPLVNDREWKTAIAVANIEVYKQVNAVLETFVGTTSDVDVDTKLTLKCEPELCAEIKAVITIVPSLEPLMERLVVGALRQAVYDKKREYAELGFNVAWLAPNISATLIGWHLEGLLSTVSSEEERIFCSEARNFLTNAMLDDYHTCDVVVFLNQLTNGLSRLEIYSALLGTSANDNTNSFRKKALQVFNNVTSTGFLHHLSSSHHFFESIHRLEAFSLDDKDIIASRITPTPSPTYNRNPYPHNRLPFTINTNHLGIALGMLAVAIQISAAVLIIVKKSRLKRLSETEQDDSLSAIGSDDGGSKYSF